ncbi:MAG TPA: sensor histidine kinase [Polyangiaceae bacterium LLY-WYZ-15_(1-7)]|nr:hypothetical protein [Sandaracinus sp.]MBJ70814.1 hypothetical protein [Sandaracinus sp.]HJL00811.1 sensor histidine kinase [Polyangiaceae bacterium LLY-WYZ-15_(1-7)]HJL13541.1 sensor histidine kinase [Polyangiaceae bacterium LLY-WYZ-15_(1-7)]
MPLGLSRTLAARSLPVLVALVAVVGASAPTAYYVVRVDELRERGAGVARELAATLGHEAARRPILWRYDSPKVVEHLRRYRPEPAAAAVRVYDDRRVPVADSGRAPPAHVWERAALGDAGEVWVAVGLASARRAALGLALPFFALGLLLAGVLWLLPRRALGAAEQRIRDLIDDLRASQRELEALNADLEGQVADRVADLEDRDRRLRELSARAVALQEAERRSIGRELHDGVGQVLTGIRLQLQLLAAREAAAERPLALVDQVIDEVRGAVEVLGPSVLDEVGLGDALARLCDDLGETSGLDVRLEAPAELDLAPALETATYRVAQEALHNAQRHADAERIELRLALGERLRLEVRDDGVGFDPAAVEEGGHGLRGMRERAELLGGSLEIASAPGEGTAILLELPIEETP